MARELPVRPSIEHLKKQAKDWLKVRQQSDANAQLTDAQHAVAREYGFASWPKLTAHVEWLMNEAPPRQHPFVGVWIANIEKSRRHPANPYRSATLEVAIDGDRVTLDDIVIDEHGREERQRNVVFADGKEQPSDRGYVLTATWRGRRVLEITGRKGAEDAGTVRYEVSPDGLTLTISDRTRQVVSVFDRR